MDETNKIVVFKLENELYGVPITQVKEIVRVQPFSNLPNVPSYIQGLINLRGNIQVIYNLKAKFNMKNICVSNEASIILANNLNIGFIVDEVSEILSISESDLDSVENLQISVNQKYISGIAKLQGKIIIVLDINEITSVVENNLINDVSLQSAV